MEGTHGIDIRDLTTEISGYDTLDLLYPFLAVIKSSTVKGDITSLALNAIGKLFSYNIISATSPRLAEAMQALSSAVTHCRFEASDSADDEVVLLRILNVMEQMMTGVGGRLLSDESVCEMMETGLSMCCQLRLSELLRRSAEISMLRMVQTVFERLKELDPLESDSAEITNYLSDVNLNGPIIKGQEDHSEQNGEQQHPEGEAHQPDDLQYKQQKLSPVEQQRQGTAAEPYGLGSICELLRVLVSLLDPNNSRQNDTMRVMALKIIDVAFEVAGAEIGAHAILRTLAIDDLCRYLFQLVRSESVTVLTNSLRAATTLLYTMRPHLKLQQELLLSYIVSCLYPKADSSTETLDPMYEGIPTKPKLKALTSGKSTPVPIKDRQKMGLDGVLRAPEAREVMVECVGGLVRIPTFMVDLFVNYDCDPNMGDLCEDVIGFLSRNAFVDAAAWSTPNVPPLCLDALLAYIRSIHVRIGKEYSSAAELPEPSTLARQIGYKQLIVKGASKFNENPGRGIEFLCEHKIIAASDKAHSLAEFLKNTSRVNKKLLGEYFAHPKNHDTLCEYLALFDFTNSRVDEALREMMQSFRLPGESQQIERIVEAFSKNYTRSDHDGIGNPDVVFVLAYAIIMLNTDLHSPNVKRRMTLDQFRNNLRGLNDGKDFSPAYLESIFEAIGSTEIIIAEEHDNQASFDIAWKELITKAKSGNPLLICNTNIYDEMMFRATWKPVVTTLAYVFSSATDDTVFSRVINAFNQCADIAATYQVCEAMDHIVLCLSKMTTLLDHSQGTVSNNTIVRVGDAEKIVSELSVRFGRDFKAQLATVVLFRICQGHENIIRHGWKQIVSILCLLYENGLLKENVSRVHQFIDVDPIPLSLLFTNKTRYEGRGDGKGLFSTLSSYLANMSDDVSAPSEDEIESTLCTTDCVSSSNLGTLIENIMGLSTPGTDVVLGVLVGEEFKRLGVNSEVRRPTPRGPGEQSRYTLTSDRAVFLFRLELALSICLKDKAHCINYADFILQLIRRSFAEDSIFLGRYFVYYLAIVRTQCLYGTEVVNPDELLKETENLDAKKLTQNGPVIPRALLSCLESCAPVFPFRDFNALVRSLTKLFQHGTSKECIFKIVCFLTRRHLTKDSFVPLIDLLLDFVGAEQVSDAKPTQNGSRERTISNDGSIGSQSLQELQLLSKRIPELAADTAKNEVWDWYWRPLLQGLTRHWVHPSFLIRQNAIRYSQGVLTGDLEIPGDGDLGQLVFQETLFPAVDQLLDSSFVHKDRKAAATQAQAISLLCNVFLSYLVKYPDYDHPTLWALVLDKIIVLSRTAAKGPTKEAIIESIKNAVLVMRSSGLMASSEDVPEDPKVESPNQSTSLWKITTERLNDVFPELVSDIK